jgi:hypothetical protein
MVVSEKEQTKRTNFLKNVRLRAVVEGRKAAWIRVRHCDWSHDMVLSSIRQGLLSPSRSHTKRTQLNKHQKITLMCRHSAAHSRGPS